MKDKSVVLSFTARELDILLTSMDVAETESQIDLGREEERVLWNRLVDVFMALPKKARGGVEYTQLKSEQK